LNQTKIPVTLEGNLLKIIEAQNDLESAPNWRLVRERDGLTKKSKDITWIEWNEDGRFKAKHDYIGVGRSLLMSPFNEFFTWQTTPVTEIIASTADSSYIKFKTGNSTYELFKL